MKNTSSKKQHQKLNSVRAQPANQQSVATPMTLTTALTYFDFSQSPPEPIATYKSINSSIAQAVGQAIYDGLRDAFIQDDTPTFTKCYQALHYCLGMDMESHCLGIGGSGTIAILMTASQAAVTFNRAKLAIALFDACIDSPDHPIRDGIGAPVPTITHAYSTWIKHGTAQDQACWLATVDQMIHGFVERLVKADPPQLCPATGLLFAMLGTMKPGENRDAIARICTAMTNRQAQLIAQQINVPQGQASNDDRL